MNRFTSYLKGCKTTLCRGLLLIALLFASTMGVYAQQGLRTISGIVVDENGEPLPGAHVTQKKENKNESQAAVAVDINGHFSLTLPASTKEIEVTYLGYEAKYVKLGKKSLTF